MTMLLFILGVLVGMLGFYFIKGRTKLYFEDLILSRLKEGKTVGLIFDNECTFFKLEGKNMYTTRAEVVMHPSVLSGYDDSGDDESGAGHA